jgi:hypothetical protein
VTGYRLLDTGAHSGDGYVKETVNMLYEYKNKISKTFRKHGTFHIRKIMTQRHERSGTYKFAVERAIPKLLYLCYKLQISN